MSGHILAIDQGTTSSRAIVFDGAMKVAGVGQQEFPQHYPASGWVEHDPEDIWSTVVAAEFPIQTRNRWRQRAFSTAKDHCPTEPSRSRFGKRYSPPA